MKLNVKACSLAFGIFWGAGIFLLTWWLIILEGGGGVTFFNRVYVGYSISPVGSVIGLLWGFVDGLISGFIFALLYNYLVDRFA